VRWNGVEWSAAALAGRLAWLAAALAVALLAAVPFSRFDPACEAGWRQRGAPLPHPAIVGTGEVADVTDITVAVDHSVARAAGGSAASGRRGRRPSPREPPRDGWPGPWPDSGTGETREACRLSRAARLVAAELRLMLARPRSRWCSPAPPPWFRAGLAAPAGEARAALLALAWIWPLPLWSELGAREAQHGTAPLILSSPLPPILQSAAIWAAGAGVAALAGSGVALRLALSGDAGDAGSLAAWTVGCLFIPALAFALGTLSGSPRLFEVVYLLLWYAGPMKPRRPARLHRLRPRRADGGSRLDLPVPDRAALAVAWAARSRQARG